LATSHPKPMKETQYLSIKTCHEELLFKEKASKFIAFIYPLQQFSDIKMYLDALKLKHPKSNHHCYAYRYGIKGEQYRANDDGEPSGSAGLPIYNQLLGHELTNVLLVVVRYFGGTKLGVSGLIKAYKEAAIMAIDASEIVQEDLQCLLRINFKFDQQHLVFSALNKHQAKTLDFTANEDCQLLAQLKTEHQTALSQLFRDLNLQDFGFEGL
jgi:uncharacterized YigZ family protein